MYDFTVLVLPGAWASGVATTLDMLSAAATLATRVGVAAPRWRVYGTAGGATPLSSGLSVNAPSLPKRARADDSVWIVPGLNTRSVDTVTARMREANALQAIAALKAQRHGGGIAASCSAVFLLQAAGLLAERTVTTSWWLAAHLKQLEPTANVDANRMVISDGRLITAGAANAQSDLMLHLLSTRFGTALADAVSRALLIDARSAQAPFIVASMLANGNELVARLTQRIEAALPDAPSIAELAAQFCMSERTLSRHVQSATGRSPLALLQSIRLGKARALLERSRLSVEQIAERVGYSDATALRRMMRRMTGVTPRQFRPAADG